MARFSVGDEEEEEEVAAGAKRRRMNQIKVQEFGGNREEFGGGTSGEEGEGDIGKNDESISVTIDPDVLECSICCEPLRPPLHQCQNGHVVCAICSSKLPQAKCPTCSQSINFTRCLALEKVIESIKSPCCHSKYGCTQSLPYIEVSSHQEACAYSPCYCPMPNCIFCGLSEHVSSHFVATHRDSAINFDYDKQFKVTLEQDQPFVVLREQHGLLFLLLNDKLGDRGFALSVACIRSSSLECDFRYELATTDTQSSLELKASTVNIKKWMGTYPNKVFLLVPKGFRFASGEIVLHVRIQKET